MQGDGNPATQQYDYQNGRGLDSFMSAAIDSVSWETSLSSTFNTLSQAPIGQSAFTNNAINYDQSQISGSQSATSTIGGGGGASAGTAGANPQGGTGLQVNATQNNIIVNDGTYNRALFGFNPTTNTWGTFATPPGIDLTNATTPQQLALSSDFSQLLVAFSGSYQFPQTTGNAGTDIYQSVNIQHNLNIVPAVLLFGSTIAGTAPGAVLNIPPSAYTFLATGTVLADNAGTSYQYNYGVDSQYVYVNRIMNNSLGFTASAGTITYYILQQTATSSNSLPVVSTGAGLTI